jgi:anti-sigma regulatory factor (Ser/Thr protein kinase)
MKTNFIREYILTEIEDIKVAIDGVMSGIEKLIPLSDSRKYEIKLVMNELLVNCFDHSHPKDRRTVVLKVATKEDKVRIYVKDNGQGFEFEYTNKRLGAPMSEERLYSENGRGLMLVNAFCDNVKYFGNGNSVEVNIAL